MKEREELLELYELYKKLLSEKEREYFEYYYFEDYSLQEIADNNSVSRAYVGKYLNNINKKLKNYEDGLNLLDKNNKIRKIINNIDENVKKRIEELL